MYGVLKVKNDIKNTLLCSIKNLIYHKNMLKYCICHYICESELNNQI